MPFWEDKQQAAKEAAAKATVGAPSHDELLGESVTVAEEKALTQARKAARVFEF